MKFLNLKTKTHLHSFKLLTITNTVTPHLSFYVNKVSSKYMLNICTPYTSSLIYSNNNIFDNIKNFMLSQKVQGSFILAHAVNIQTDERNIFSDVLVTGFVLMNFIEV